MTSDLPINESDFKCKEKVKMKIPFLVKKTWITHYDHVQLSNEVCKENGGKPSDNWEIYDAYYPHGEAGFGICAYINRVKKAIVIAIRGNDILVDMHTKFKFTLFNRDYDDLPHVKRFINTVRENLNLIEKDKRKMNHIATALFKDLVSNLDTIIKIYEQFDKDLNANQRMKINDIYYEYLSKYYNSKGMAENSAIHFLTYLFGHYLLRFFKGSFFYFLDLILADKKTRVELIKSAGIDNPDTIEYLTKKLNEIEGYFKIGLDETTVALEMLKIQYPEYSISLTGHSIGGLLAEVCACELLIPAVTLDSPGSYTIASKTQHFDESVAKELITGYLSAPNLINTMGKHIGVKYRLYMHHIDEKTSETLLYKLGYYSRSVLNTAKRISVPVFVYNPVVGGLVLTVTSTAKVIIDLYQDHNWIRNQHNIANMLNCFNKSTGNINNISKIISWPSSFNNLQSNALRALTSFSPFRSDNYGIYTYVNSNENAIIESMIENMYGYNVTKIEHPFPEIHPLPFDDGGWDAYPEQDLETDQFIFTYWVFKQGKKVGYAKFYGRPEFCRSQDAQRHNVIELKGVLADYKKGLELETINVICDVLPPTLIDQWLKCVEQGAWQGFKQGGLLGLGSVVGNTLHNRLGYNKTIANNSRRLIYYGGMWLVNFCHYYTQQSEHKPLSNQLYQATYSATVDTMTLAGVTFGLNKISQYCHWGGEKLQQPNWNWSWSGSALQRVGGMVNYLAYAYRSYMQGFVHATVSIVVGAGTQKTVETLGNILSDGISHTLFKPKSNQKISQKTQLQQGITTLKSLITDALKRGYTFELDRLNGERLVIKCTKCEDKSVKSKQILEKLQITLSDCVKSYNLTKAKAIQLSNKKNGDLLIEGSHPVIINTVVQWLKVSTKQTLTDTFGCRLQ